MPKKHGAKQSKKPTAKKAKVDISPVASQPLYPERNSLPLPSVWRISATVGQLLWRHKNIFLSLALIYGLLNLVLVRGFSGGTNVSDLKTQLDQVFTGHYASLASSLTIFASLVSTSGNTSSSTGGAYQTFLLAIMSLAVIWTLRMAVAGERFRLRDSFYKSMYPLIPFLLVFFVICIQLIPLLIGAGVYSTVATNGIAVTALEKILWGVGCGLLAAVSLYWIVASSLALYIVTLPNMTPLKALRSARQLVRGRRLSVLRKLLFLPLAIFVIAVIIMVPVILLLPALAQWLFFVLTMCSLVVVHAYIYTVYRELLS